MNRAIVLLVPVALALAACGDTENPDEINDNELITTVNLAFAPASGGEPLVFTWADPEGDGSPVVDEITLSDAEDYALEVSFLDELQEPIEELTDEVAAESDEHQVFFTGSAVGGVVEHAYADTDDNGFPVGLESAITTAGTGSGTFVVTLRHLPPESGNATKTGTLANQVAAAGFDAIPGSTDAQVTFDLTVE